MPQHTLLAPITPNRVQKNLKLSPQKRGLIKGYHEAGISIINIACVLNTLQSTVQTTLCCYDTQLHSRSKPHTSWPKVLDAWDEHTILHIICLNL